MKGQKTGEPKPETVAKIQRVTEVIRSAAYRTGSDTMRAVR